MSGRKPWTADDKARLTELHGEGKSLHAIAKLMGRSTSVISRHADANGLDFDRGKTKAAAEAVHVDNAARQVALARRFFDLADHSIDRAYQPARVYSFGGADNRYAEEWLDDGPPPADLRAYTQTAAAAATMANKLHAATAGHQAEKAISALAKMQQGLAEFATEYEEERVADDAGG